MIADNASQREENAVETLVVTIEGRRFEFSLDPQTQRWAPVALTTHDLLQESEFPLIGHAAGKRYELYSDGTFAEVEL